MTTRQKSSGILIAQGGTIGGGMGSDPIPAGYQSRGTAFHFTNGALVPAKPAQPRLPVAIYLLDTPLLKAGSWNQTARFNAMLQHVETEKEISQSAIDPAQRHRVNGPYVRAHSTFIAGLISSIAPSARIVSIPVLNEKGIGSEETMFAGIWAAANDQQHLGRIKLVNMSFTIYSPVMTEEELKAASAAETNGENPAQAAGRLSIRTTFADWVATNTPDPKDDAFDYRHLTFFAATGDDDGSPAAYQSVTTASGYGNASASANDYSADTAPPTSTAARQGDALFPARSTDVVAVTGTSGAANRAKPKEPLSGQHRPNFAAPDFVFGRFVNEKELDTLYEWQGTSFSTAIVTAVTAALLTGDLVRPDGGPLNLGTPDEALAYLAAISTYDATSGAYRLPIAQG
jgi:hypothetical protein